MVIGKFCSIANQVTILLGGNHWGNRVSTYQFIVLNGELKIVNDPKERENIIQIFSNIGRKKFSEKFLAAHGFKSDKEWHSFNKEGKILILKLEKIIKETALKSP